MWSLEICAGYNYFDYKGNFTSNNNDHQWDVLLINIRLFKKAKLYSKTIFVFNSYNDFQNPSQDILDTIANYKFVFILLNFILNLHFDNNQDNLER